MKRTKFVNNSISFILGLVTGAFIQLAISAANTFFAILAILTAIGAIINTLCGPDTMYKEKIDIDKEY